MLIRDIDAIGKPGVNLLENSDIDIIDEIVELPLRSACKLFRDKGIETVMSSANKNNILKDGEKALEREDVIENFSKLFETHTFLDAGVGYAWIMINFDTLSDENKDLVFALEDKLGSKAVWFVHPASMSGDIEHSLKTGKYDYDFAVSMLGIDNVPKDLSIDEKLIEFDRRAVVLLYHWISSSTEAVFLRMPVSSQTTVEEVSEYFVNLAECFNNQVVSDIGESNRKMHH